MKKLFLSICFMNLGMALEVFDQPSQNANLLIIGNVNSLQLLDDSYVHVLDPNTKVKGYVKYDDYQKARLNADMKKQYPQLANMLGREEAFKDKAALLAENVKNKQAQLADIKKRMHQRSLDSVLSR